MPPDCLFTLTLLALSWGCNKCKSLWPSSQPCYNPAALKRSLDVLILFALVTARVQIDTLADVAGVGEIRFGDVRQLVEGWWPAWSLDLLAGYNVDPVSLMLIVAAFGLLALYMLVDFFSPKPGRSHYLKLALLYGLILLLVFGKTFLYIGLRQQRGLASYSHDGGTIQTEAAIDYFLRGLNPYVEDYVETPMAEWGFSEYRTALYHYPYLPWTFVFSAPFRLLSEAVLGWYDQRLVYLLLFAVTLLLVPALVRRPTERLIALAVIGLNPIAGTSVIFGENDPFVLAWIGLALWLVKPGPDRARVRSGYFGLGSAAVGLACASKPTAWFLIPFWLLYLLGDSWGPRFIQPLATWRRHLTTLVRRAWPLPVIALLLIGPWFVWNPAAMYDDVWRWSSGQGETGYQIWGWGASNLVLAFGWVADRFEYWPFVIPGAIVTFPLLLLLLWRQTQNNTLSTMLYAYVLLLLPFFYTSRFLQPNYLGYMLGFLALALTMDEAQPAGERESGS